MGKGDKPNTDDGFKLIFRLYFIRQNINLNPLSEFCLSPFLLIFSHLVGFFQSTISPYRMYICACMYIYIYIYIFGGSIHFFPIKIILYRNFFY